MLLELYGIWLLILYFNDGSNINGPTTYSIFHPVYTGNVQGGENITSLLPSS